MTTEAPVPFEVVYEQEFPGLVRLAFLLTGSLGAAEEAVQDAFANAHVRWAKLDNPPAYVRRSVVNGSRNELRRRATARRYAARLAVRNDVLPAPSELLDTLARLPERQRAALVLRFYEDQSEKEIARLLGVREGTVKSLISRGLATLRAEVKP